MSKIAEKVFHYSRRRFPFWFLPIFVAVSSIGASWEHIAQSVIPFVIFSIIAELQQRHLASQTITITDEVICYQSKSIFGLVKKEIRLKDIKNVLIRRYDINQLGIAIKIVALRDSIKISNFDRMEEIYDLLHERVSPSLIGDEQNTLITSAFLPFLLISIVCMFLFICMYLQVFNHLLFGLSIVGLGVMIFWNNTK